MQKVDFLEWLALRSGCDYLSDLRVPHNPERVAASLLDVTAEQCSLAEWNEAVQYLTGAPGAFQSAGEARDHLLQFLEGME
ncbi:hypothetical protein [uncultured Oscillibacter sp.]|uniref:hypothetical protein n=1 Tax=uncultured Oscillibacter sp. TaxID=876091 RepID=UPI0025CEEE6F|nr:hypothetical protein [uncultured Oscillibacter sp.]